MQVQIPFIEFPSVFFLGLATCVDSYFYGRFTFVPLNFFTFNVLKNISTFYGDHEWHWYLTNALPSLLGILILPTALAVLVIMQRPALFAKKDIYFLNLLAILGYLLFHRYMFS